MSKVEFTEARALEICANLANGIPLARMCQAVEFPSVNVVYRWLAENDKFREMYLMARLDQADTYADEIIAISDDGLNDTYIDDNGRQQTNQDVIQRSRLRVDARKWVAAKLKPHKYGDLLRQEHTSPDGSMTPIPLPSYDELRAEIERRRRPDE